MGIRSDNYPSFGSANIGMGSQPYVEAEQKRNAVEGFVLDRSFIVGRNISGLGRVVCYGNR